MCSNMGETRGHLQCVRQPCPLDSQMSSQTTLVLGQEQEEALVFQFDWGSDGDSSESE